MATGLIVNSMSLHIGGVVALQDVNVSVYLKEVVGLIGPNGAGKTSLINCITGIYRYQAGSVHFGEMDLTKMAAHRIAARGVVRTFQQGHLVAGMTVAENLLLARHAKMKCNIAWEAIRFGPSRREERSNEEFIGNLLCWLGIEAWKDRRVESLTLWEQKQVVVARALAGEPRVILFDEPAAGLSRGEKESLAVLLAKVRDEMDIAQLVVEHDLPFVAALCDRAIVLALGRKLAEGPPAAVLVHSSVVEAYLGGVAYEPTDDG